MTAPSTDGPDAVRRRRRLPHISLENRQIWAVVVAALLAPIAQVEIVGSGVVDVVWMMALAGLGAYLATTAKRGPLILAACVAIADARAFSGAVFAVLALAFAVSSTWRLRRRAAFLRGASGGAVVISLLCSSMHQPALATGVAAVTIAASIVLSGFRNASPRAQKVLRRSFVAAFAFSVLATGMAGLGVLQNRAKVDRGSNELQLGLAFARAGDAESAAVHLDQALLQLDAAHDRIDRWGRFGRLVPVVGQNVDALTAILGDVAVAAGQAGSTAGAADTDRLTVNGGSIDLNAMSDLENPFRRLTAALSEVLDKVRDHLDGPLLPPLRDKLHRLGNESERAYREASLGAEAARVMPRALGGDGTKRYLVLFTSPAEARGPLGFPASYAEVSFTNGRFLLGEHGSTSATFNGLKTDQTGFDLGDPLLRPYVPFGPTRTFLSATVPPDFPTVAEVAAELWAQSGRRPVDGVLRFDPASLAALMAFTGNVQVKGVPQELTPQNLERFLVLDQYLQFPNDQAPRREVLETVSEVVFDRLQSADLPAPRTLVDLFKPLVEAGHLQVTSRDTATEAFLRRVRLDGRFAAPVDDGLLVTNVNSTGNKIDTFLSRSMHYDGEVSGRTLDATLSVELTNGAPSSKLPFYVLGSFTDPPLAPGTNRTTLFVYSAVPATSIEVDGVTVSPRTELTGGRWLSQTQLDLPPGGTRTVTLHLQGELPAGAKNYQLQLEPSGGGTPDQYDVEVRHGGGESATFRGRVVTRTLVR